MLGLPDGTRACLFDLDGVLTDTASVHAAAWKQMFDDYLRERDGDGFRPFDVSADYGPYVDGKPRLDGTDSFLRSRGIALPHEELVRLSTIKNDLVQEKIVSVGVEVYPGSVRYLEAVREAGLATAVVSSSANAEQVLRVADLAQYIDHRVDGVTAKERGLRGKPAPDTFLAAAADLGVDKADAVVFEDALAGVASGKAGGFGFVVGVDRLDQAEQLRAQGADVVVQDLADLLGGPVVSPDPGRAFLVEPWVVREPHLDLQALGQAESVFALSNGHIGLRGNLDEGEPHDTPGTYLNSFYEKRPLPYAEGGYGYPESGQTIINVTNGKLIRLLVEDEPLDLRYGRVHRHERVLDLQAGTLTREVEWESPAGRRVKLRTERLVSLTQRAIAAIRYEVEVLDAPALLVVQSELVANEALPSIDEDDPRVEAAMTDPLVAEQHRHSETSATLVHQTRASGLRVRPRRWTTRCTAPRACRSRRRPTPTSPAPRSSRGSSRGRS
jgi:beta-phosphoglucomutase family hydrolase